MYTLLYVASNVDTFSVFKNLVICFILFNYKMQCTDKKPYPEIHSNKLYSVGLFYEKFYMFYKICITNVNVNLHLNYEQI